MISKIKKLKKHTTKMTTVKRTLLAAAACLLAIGCGGSQSSKKEMSKLAADAPPPPTGGGKISRQVSAEAEKDFAAAVAFYQEQAKSGWMTESCNAAASRFEDVAEAHNKMVEARFNAGLSYQNCRIMKEAEDQYQKALKINPGHAPSLSNLGQIYFLGGNEARAKQWWERAVDADPKVVGARNNLAWLMIRDAREGKTSLKAIEEKAEGHLQRVLAVDNENVEAYVLLSLLYMEGSERNKSRLTLAKLLLDKGEEANANYAPLYNARGLLLMRQENVAQALATFRKAVAIDPKFVEARMNVGNIVLDFRKYAEGAEQFEEVLKLQSKNYDAHVGLGIAQRGMKELDKAEASYKKAMSLDQGRPEAFFNLGVLYMDFRANETTDLKKAQAAYRSASDYFSKAMSKGGLSKAMSKEARENVKLCEKNIKSLEEAIKFQQQSNQPAAGNS